MTTSTECPWAPKKPHPPELKLKDRESVPAEPVAGSRDGVAGMEGMYGIQCAFELAGLIFPPEAVVCANNVQIGEQLEEENPLNRRSPTQREDHPEAVEERT
jgi:hypothetical protein